jgi:hypothetical protein
VDREYHLTLLFFRRYLTFTTHAVTQLFPSSPAINSLTAFLSQPEVPAT